MNQEKIGKFIARCRKDNKMTQQELAEKLNISDRAVSNWENGKNMPDLSLFKPLCEIFNININDLLNGEIVDKDNSKEIVQNTIEYANKEIKKVENKTKKKIIFIIIIFIFLLGLIFGISDYSNIKYGKHPNFMIRITDGSKTTHYYIGLGYMMERKVGVSYKEPLISDTYVRFGILFFDWNVDILKTSPDNLYLYSSNNSLMANMGSYCWTADLNDKKSSVCADTIGPVEMKYDSVLEVKKGDKIFLNLKDYMITNVSLYDTNELNYKIIYDNENNTISVPQLLGEYIMVVDFKYEQGQVWYSFKVSISE